MKNYQNGIKRLAFALLIASTLGGCVAYGDGGYNDGWWGGGDRGDHRDRRGGDRDGDRRGGDRDGDRRGGDHDGDRGGDRR